MKKELSRLSVDNEIFKRLLKHKKTIYVLKDDEFSEKLEKKTKIIISNEKGKKIKRKIKKVYHFDNLEKLKENLKKKQKYLYPKNIEDTNDNKYLALEFKCKKKIFRKIFAGMLVLASLFILGYYINSLIDDYKENKFKDKINNIKEEISYVVIEINPKMVIELKNGKVTKTGCLNEDCKSVFDDINVLDKSIKEVITILYKEAKNSGIDVSGGVKVSSTNKEVQEEIKELDYTIYIEINKEEEKEYLDNVLDNNEIKEQTSKVDINNKLLEAYKSDSDYGKYYTCSIENNEIGCYITAEFENTLSSFGTFEETLDELYASINNVRKFENILDKFNVEYVSGGVSGLNVSLVQYIYTRGNKHELTGEFCYGSSTITMSGPVSSYEACYNRAGVTIYNDETEYIHVVTVPLSKFNLVTSDYNDSDLVTVTIDQETDTLKITNNK